jgi:hypothetical protein
MTESPLAADQTPTEPTAPANAADTERAHPAKTRFRRWRWSLLLLASLLAAVAEELWDSAGSTEPLFAISMGLMLPLIWAVVWSIAGRLISGEFRFGEHVALGSIAVIALIVDKEIRPPLHAYATEALEITVSAIVLFVAAAYVFAQGLLHVLRGRGRRAVFALSAVLGLVLGAFYYVDRAEDHGKLRLNSGFFPGTLWFSSVEPLDEVLASDFFAGGDRELKVVTATQAAARRSSKRDSVRVHEALEIDRTEVTARDYRACVSAKVCSPALAAGACNFDAADDLPINCVRIEQARAYCAWAGGKLPDDAEWFAAARGSDETRPYPWGKTKPTCARAVLKGCAEGPLPVATRGAGRSPSGAHDLIGNVREWVESVDENLPATISTRGSSFRDVASEVITERSSWAPWTALDSIGFRCAYPGR